MTGASPDPRTEDPSAETDAEQPAVAEATMEELLAFDAEIPLAEASAVHVDQVGEADPTAPVEMLIVDDGQVGADAMRRLTNFGYLVSTVPPSPDLARELRHRRIQSVAINLAARDAWGAARRLNGAYPNERPRFYAYALGSESANGFWFGPIEFYFLSLGDTPLADALRRLTPILRRVLLLGSDRTLNEQVCAQLEKAGISTSAVSDVRWLAESLTAVKPQAAVVHLAPRWLDMFRALGVLRRHELSREIPILFLVDTSATPRDITHFSTGLRILVDSAPVDARRIVDHLTFALKLNAHRKPGA